MPLLQLRQIGPTFFLPSFYQPLFDLQSWGRAPKPPEEAKPSAAAQVEQVSAQVRQLLDRLPPTRPILTSASPLPTAQSCEFLHRAGAALLAVSLTTLGVGLLAA